MSFKQSYIFLIVVVIFFYRSAKVFKIDERKKSIIIQSVALVNSLIVFLINDFVNDFARKNYVLIMIFLIINVLLFIYFSFQDSRYMKEKRLEEERKKLNLTPNNRQIKKINTDYNKNKKKRKRKK